MDHLLNFGIDIFKTIVDGFFCMRIHPQEFFFDDNFITYVVELETRYEEEEVVKKATAALLSISGPPRFSEVIDIKKDPNINYLNGDITFNTKLQYKWMKRCELRYNRKKNT